jgi:hypothetical protein
MNLNININNSMNRDTYEMINSAMVIIKELNCEDLIKNYNGEGGFMFPSNDEIKHVMLQISKNYGGHSGASLAYTMRNCQYFLSNLFEWNDICSINN